MDPLLYRPFGTFLVSFGLIAAIALAVANLVDHTRVKNALVSSPSYSTALVIMDWSK